MSQPGSEPQIASADVECINELLVEVAARDDATFEPDPSRVVWLQAFELLLPAGWAETATRSAMADADAADNFYLDHRRNVTQWGADAAVEQVLVTISQAVYVHAALLVVEHLARKVSARVLNPETREMTEDDAVEWARTRVSTKYGATAGELRVAKAGHSEGDTIVELTDPDGVRYRLRMRGAGAGVMLAECTRTFPEPPTN